MDRKGLTESIESKDALIQCFQWNIRECEKQKADLEAQLAEAENTGLRHGDYGVDGDNDSFIVVEQSTLYGTPKAFFESQRGQVHADKKMSPDFRIANIFREIKELAKPLTCFNVDGREYKFDLGSDCTPIKIAGIWHSLPNAKEISTDLQRLIFTYEQATAKKK